MERYEIREYKLSQHTDHSVVMNQGFQWINSFAKEFRKSSEDNECKEIRNEKAAIENNRPDYAPVLSNEGAASATTTAVPQLQQTPPGPPPPFSIQNYTVSWTSFKVGKSSLIHDS